MPIRRGQGACWRPGKPSYFLKVTRPGDRCSQGGVKVPTGGKGDVAQARERLLPSEILLWKSFGKKGQQIRCDSEADGQSPDERERSRRSARLRVACRSVCPDSGPERGKP